MLYIEYEHISGADKILKEIEGHDVEADTAGPNCSGAQGAQTSRNLSSCFPKCS